MGIAGWIDYANNNAKESRIIDLMQEGLKHSDLERKSVFLSKNAIFVESSTTESMAVRPLSIKGKGEVFTLIFKGKLFNTRQVKQALLQQKVVFDSDRVEEVVLQAYIQWGEACLERFNGTFCFAVWQHNTSSLFLATDRVGVKSLYYYRTKNGLIFSSELKALLKNPEVPKEIDREGLQQILLLGPSRVVGSGAIRGVAKLKPAETLYLDKYGLKVSTYWRLCAANHKDNYSQTIEKTRELIIDAVESQIDITNNTASFLSGGLDSSIIAKIVADYYKKYNQSLTTYSVDYKDNDKYFVSNSYQPDSDNLYIQIMSNAIGSQHINIQLDSLEVAKAIREAAVARGYPGMGDIDSSLLLFCRLVSQKHNLCLSGECADEIFGGYPWYHRKELLYKESFPWSDSIELRKSLFRRDYLGANPDEYVDNIYKNTLAYTNYLDSDDRHNRRIREMFVLNFYYFMQTLIERSEQMSVYGGVEVLLPFADYRLVEYAFNMPWEYKSLNGREKGIMREAFKNILPSEIINRKKSPYPKTFDPLLFDYVKQQSSKLVYSKDSILYELIDKEFFEKLYSGKQVAASPWYGQLMREPQIFAYLMQLDIFFKEFCLTII